MSKDDVPEQLWLLSPNPLSDDNESIWHSGLGDYRYCMPTMNCPRCGVSVTVGDVSSAPCPPLVAKEMEAVRAEQPLRGYEEWVNYARRWEQMFRDAGQVTDLRSGMEFAPFIWRTPTLPTYTIYWVLPWQIVVHERLQTRLTAAQITGVDWLPVILEKAGEFEARDPIPDEIWDKCDEPEDLVDHVPAHESPESIGKFFALKVLSSSFDRWLDVHREQISTCSICGRVTIPRGLEIQRNKERSYYRKRRQLPGRYVCVGDVFRSHVYDEGVVLTDHTAELLDGSDLTNCQLQRITVAV